VLTAEQNLYQAQNNLASAMGNVSASLTTTYRALGGGWQIREGNGFVNDETREEMRARTNYGDILPPAGQPQPQAPGPARPTSGRPCGLRNGDRREDLPKSVRAVDDAQFSGEAKICRRNLGSARKCGFPRQRPS
jgi:hypothetical protein